MYTAVQVYLAEPTGENRGQFHHRLASPARLFADSHELHLQTLSLHDPAFPKAALACDLLIIHTLTAPELEALIRWRRAHGKPTLYEIADNFLALGDWLPGQHALRSPLVRQTICYYASLCDGMQVSSPGLAQQFRLLNRRVAVLDNYVPVPPSVPARPPAFVFGWAGTQSHEADLAAVAPVLIAFCRRHRDAVFAFMGDAGCFQRLFAAVPPSQVRFQPFGVYTDYLAFLQTLRVGLGPLQDTAFNRCRTDVKFVEFAVSGAAAVLANAPVYRPHATRALLFADQDELNTAMETLYAAPERGLALAQRAFTWVSTSRNADAIRRQRLAFYRDFLPSAPARMPLPTPTSHSHCLCERLALAWQAHRGKHFTLSLQHCNALLQERPDYVQAQWLAVQNLSALKRYDEVLAAVARSSPSPIYHDLLAATAYRAAQQVCPAAMAHYFARLKSPLLRLQLRRGDGVDRATFYRRILEHQPYDYFALLALLRMLQRQALPSSELSALLERAHLLAPETA